MQYWTKWRGLEQNTWEHEGELQQYGSQVQAYWADQPEQVQVAGENAKYRRYRIQLAKRAVTPKAGGRHVATGYKLCLLRYTGEAQHFYF